MSDFIEREKLRKRLNQIVDVNNLRTDRAWFTPYGVNSLIEEIPAADVRPVKRGKWEHSFDELSEYYKCSNCGKEYFVGPIVTLNFCAYCGADMREVLGDE